MITKVITMICSAFMFAYSQSFVVTSIQKGNSWEFQKKLKINYTSTSDSSYPNAILSIKIDNVNNKGNDTVLFSVSQTIKSLDSIDAPIITKTTECIKVNRKTICSDQFIARMFSDIEYVVCDSGSSGAWKSYTLRDTLKMNNGFSNLNALNHRNVYQAFGVSPQYSVDSMMFVDSIGLLYQYDIYRSSYDISRLSEIQLVKFGGVGINLSVDVQNKKHFIEKNSGSKTKGYRINVDNKYSFGNAISLNGRSLASQKIVNKMAVYIDKYNIR